MTHPDGAALRHSDEQRIVAAGKLELRAAVLALAGGLDPPARVLHQQLHAVADPEHGNAQIQDRFVEPRCVFLRDAGRPTREHQRARRGGLHLLGLDPGRHDLAVDVLFPNATRDQLRELGAVVDDQDAFSRAHRATSRASSWAAPR